MYQKKSIILTQIVHVSLFTRSLFLCHKDFDRIKWTMIKVYSGSIWSLVSDECISCQCRFACMWWISWIDSSCLQNFADKGCNPGWNIHCPSQGMDSVWKLKCHLNHGSAGEGTFFNFMGFKTITTRNCFRISLSTQVLVYLLLKQKLWFDYVVQESVLIEKKMHCKHWKIIEL